MNKQLTFLKLEKLIEFLKGKPPIYFQKIERIIIILIIEELKKKLYQLGLELDGEKIKLDSLNKRSFGIDNHFETSNFDRNLFYLLKDSAVDRVHDNKVEKQNLQKKVDELIDDLDFKKVRLDWSFTSNLYKVRIDKLFKTVKEFDNFSIANIVTICESIIYRYELFNLRWIHQSSGSAINLNLQNSPFYLSLIDENFILPLNFEEYEEDPFEAILKEREKDNDY